jgi:hypothetical protein
MNSTLTKILLACCVVLVILLSVSYRRNQIYKADNTRLILLNDSIMSVNIELKDVIESADTSKVKVVRNAKKKK